MKLPKHYLAYLGLSCLSLMACDFEANANNQELIVTENETVSAEVEASISGEFGLLSLASDGKTITGMYEMYLDPNGEADCSFYFYGKYQGAKTTPILAFYPDISEAPVKGTLDLSQNKQVVLKLEAQPANNCLPELTQGGETLERSSVRNWRAIRLVKSQEAVLYQEPDENLPLPKKLMRYDLIKVREEREGWLRIEYQSALEMLTGWVKVTDVYPVNVF